MIYCDWCKAERYKLRMRKGEMLCEECYEKSLKEETQTTLFGIELPVKEISQKGKKKCKR